jgi:hypothetical protein
MPVATFEQTDFETQSGTEYKTAIDGDVAVMARLAASFAPHEQSTPNMTVRLDAGDLFVNGALVQQAAQNTGTITAPTVNPRIDRVVIDALTGVVSVITGVEAGSPVPPAITTGKLPVCQVALATTTTVIDNSLLTDERVPASGGGLELATDGEAEARTVTTKAVAPSQIKWGGGLVLQEKKTFSNALYVEFTGLVPGRYKLIIRALQGTSNYPYLRINNDSGNNYYYQLIAAVNGISYFTSEPAVTCLYLSYSPYEPYAGDEIHYELDITTWHSNNNRVNISGKAAYLRDNRAVAISLGGTYLGTAGLSSVKYHPGNGSITGDALLYKFMDD